MIANVRVRPLASLLFLALALLVPATALAQMGDPALGGPVRSKRSIQIELSGDLNLSLVRRNSAFFSAALGDAVTGAAGSPLFAAEPGAGSGGDFLFDPFLSLNLDFQLAENELVNAVVTLETPFNIFNDAGGASIDTRNAGVGGGRRFLDIEQAYVNWAYNEAINLRLGVQDYTKDFTNRGNPFLIDVSHSESPFLNPGFGAADFGTPQASSGGLVGTQEAAGLLATYRMGDAASLDLFYFTILETFRKNNDDVMFGAVYERAFEGDDLRGQFGATVLGLQNGGGSYLWTFGGGGMASMFGDSIEIYGEGYAQVGEYADNAAGVKVDQKEAYAVYGGFRYYIPGEEDPNRRPYFDISYWEVSGDRNGADGTNSAFVSLENNNDTIVVEDGYYGLDIDQNYRAIKLKAGYSPAPRWDLEVLYAYFELVDNNGTVDNTPAEHDKIGDEIDFNARFFVTDYLTLRLGMGWLLDPNALGGADDMSVALFQASIDF